MLFGVLIMCIMVIFYMLVPCYIYLLLNVQVGTTQSMNYQMTCAANFSADVSFVVYLVSVVSVYWLFIVVLYCVLCYYTLLCYNCVF